MILKTPHINIGISIEKGIEILSSISSNIEKYEENSEDFYLVSVEDFKCGFYTRNGVIHATWYNDSIGRDSELGIKEKISLYLSRYGDIENWDKGLNNGWMQFFNNENQKICMVYGLHKDVIRFNSLE